MSPSFRSIIVGCALAVISATYVSAQMIDNRIDNRIDTIAPGARANPKRPAPMQGDLAPVGTCFYSGVAVPCRSIGTPWRNYVPGVVRYPCYPGLPFYYPDAAAYVGPHYGMYAC